MRGGGEKLKRSVREELLWTDHNPYSPSLCTAWGGEEVEELEMKLSLGRMGERCLNFYLFLTIPLLFLIGNILNIFS